jgi:RNA polymerase sigma-70 factor (ECF subfamily)
LKSSIDYKKLSDEELIKEFQKEDTDAFKELVNRYKDKLVNFLYRFTGNRESAEDISQEAFLKLYKNKDRYIEISKFSTWFYTIAINEAKTNYRREKKHAAVSINDFYRDEHEDYQIKSGDRIADEITDSEIESAIIQKAINSLGKDHREVIILRDIEGFEYEEISEILKIPTGTVRSRINRAREFLKISLRKLYNSKKT